jgi:hypothetical protein
MVVVSSQHVVVSFLNESHKHTSVMSKASNTKRSEGMSPDESIANHLERTDSAALALSILKVLEWFRTNISFRSRKKTP